MSKIHHPSFRAALTPPRMSSAMRPCRDLKPEIAIAACRAGQLLLGYRGGGLFIYCRREQSALASTDRKIAKIWQ